MVQNYSHAIVRRPSENFDRGLTTSILGAPSYEKILAQHQAYVAILNDLGLQVHILAPLPDFPDAYFVEDVAVMTPRLGVITRPGAKERRGEEEAIIETLAAHRPLTLIEAPATLDGGDVLIAGNDVFIGRSARTNVEGARQLATAMEAQGFRCAEIPVGSGLHLKSSVSWVGNETLLLTRELAERPDFRGYATIVLHPEDEYAANSLWINGTVLIPAGYPRVMRELSSSGAKVIELDISEARKMDGGLSCMSLRF